MSITVRFFASLSEELGFNQKIVEHKSSLTIEDVWRNVADRSPPRNLLCAKITNTPNSTSIWRMGMK